MHPLTRPGRPARLAVLAVVALALPATAPAVAAPAPSAVPASSAAPAVPVAAVPVAGAERAERAEQAVAALRERAADPAGLGRLSPGDVVLDADGTTHVRLTRTWRGLPVRGGDVVVHQGPHQGWEGVSRTLEEPLDVAVEPRLDAAAARAAVLGDPALGRQVRHLRAGSTDLVLDAVGAEPRLAWEVRTSGRRADGTPSLLVTSLDARTGEVLRRDEQVRTVDGSGRSLYAGTVPLRLSPAGTRFELRDATRGGTVTVDVGNATDSRQCQSTGRRCATGPVVSGPDTLFGDGTVADRDSAAVDAQYGTDVTWDYYRQVHGRTGIFGDGRGSSNRVHYGRGYVNAFWDGTKMTYGDGDGTEFGPLVSLDVAGHEMSHGLTQATAGLVYSGEAGGLNEATSDIFGTMVEFYAANPADPGDYLIGEQFDLASHRGFRRMDDPASDGRSQSCWTSATRTLDPHYSSGVGNHFFYLLAEGSGSRTLGGVAHRSTTCDGSVVTGIGRDAAQRIWFRALEVYLTSASTYADARAATLRAAGDLFGTASTQRAGVAAAWDAVAVR